MKIIKNENDKGQIFLKIEGKVTIYSIRGLKKVLFKLFDNCNDIELDMSGVERLDSAGFQLLALIQRESRYKEKNFKIVKASNEVTSMFNILGEKI